MITGSFSGILRVYHPRQKEFQPDDLLLEQQLDGPILQLAAGHFIAGKPGLALAVLHPRRMVVYEVAIGAQQGAHVLERAYEHTLEGNSYSIAHGPLPSAGLGAMDMIAVQGMDGTVTVFEGDARAFSCALDHFLLPGPWLYAPFMDAFLSCNSRFEVACYRRGTLSRIQGATGGDDQEGTRRTAPDWSVNVGEHMLDVQLARFTKDLGQGQQDIMVLSMQTLQALGEDGSIRYQRRFDFQPVCMAAYDVPGADSTSGGKHNLLISTATGAIMVFRESALLWAARTERAPISFRVSSFGGVDGAHVPPQGQASTRGPPLMRRTRPAGMIASLAADGSVTVLYLGTDPPSGVVSGGRQDTDLDYEAMDSEHRRLLHRIRDVASSGRQEPQHFVSLRAQVPAGVDEGEDLADDMGTPGPSVTVRIFVSYNGPSAVQNLTLNARCAEPFFAVRPSEMVEKVRGGNGTPVMVPITFGARADALPYDLEVRSNLAQPTRCHRMRFIPSLPRLPPNSARTHTHTGGSRWSWWQATRQTAVRASPALPSAPFGYPSRWRYGSCRPSRWRTLR